MRAQRPIFRWLTGLLLLSLLGVGMLGGAGLSARAAPRQQSTLDVIINEVAWMGTQYNANDEWIELYNPTSNDIDLTGWQLLFKSSPTVIEETIDLSPNLLPGNILLAGAYFLLERTDDTTTDITADLIYTGALTNTGMILELVAPGNIIIDTANGNGGAWPAGLNTSPTQRFSMERISITMDSDLNWASNNGVIRNGFDAATPTGNPINGTPKQPNSALTSYSPLSIIINEVAWMGTVASSDDEWIELYNPGSSLINLTNWRLVADDGSPDIVLNGTIASGGYFLLERAYDNVITDVTADQIYIGELEDSGETLRLRAPDGTIVDTANSDGGAWPAGTVSPNGSMERMDVIADTTLAWVTNVNMASWLNDDAAGQPVHGTPGRLNWGFGVTQTPIPATPTAVQPLRVVINEVAWAGTQSSSNDEWIELYNPSGQNISLNGWSLKAADGSPNIALSGTIKSGDYFLLERTDEDTTDVPSDLIYTGSLSNTGEILRLYDPNGHIVDTANSNGGAWPAGITSTYSSMERSRIATDSDFVWVTYDASEDNGTIAKDASGNDIHGTPGRGNSQINVTPTVTPGGSSGSSSGSSGSSGGTVLQPILGISEFLPRPGYDWNNDGQVDVFDEFIEIINAGQIDVDLSSYQVDDEANLGSSPYKLPDITLEPGERAVFYASETGVSLSDAGDTVRLLRGSTVIDAYTYSVVRYPDWAWCRIPDRLGYWNDPCFPTPGNPNALTGTLPQPPASATGYRPPVCLLPDTTPEEFVYAECEAGGRGIWNRLYWDGLDTAERSKLEDEEKWGTVFE
jgi:hypothetical protein